ncbi:MAG: PorT family protein [Bacteroidetes bacterium]|nr:MAG: PorT family protein [Bacteroidota bacterium]
MSTFSLSKFTFLALFVVGLAMQVSAQSYGRHPFDSKKFNLGFLIGLNYNAYNLKEQVNIWDEGKLLEKIDVRPKLGLTLGMISNFRLATDNISLRFIPSISLEQRDFDYYFAGDTAATVRKIEASYLNLPLLFQFKTNMYERTRLYVLMGPQLGLNLASNKKVRDDPNLLKIKTEDFSFVVGLGLNLYGDRIKLSPEIRYSIGLINIYEPLYTSHAYAIGKLMSQVITINVNFE